MSSLDESLLRNIFKHLSPDGLQTAFQVCREWRRIILSTPSLMEKIILKFTFEDSPEKQKWSGTGESPNDRIRRFLMANGKAIINAKLYGIMHEYDWIIILNLLPNLKTLTVLDSEPKDYVNFF